MEPALDVSTSLRAGGNVPACLQAGGACLGGGSTAILLALGLAAFQLVLVG